jgi:hypothetical protein
LLKSAAFWVAQRGFDVSEKINTSIFRVKLIQNNKSAEADNKLNDMFLLLSLFPASAGFLFGLLFDREDGSEILLRNAGLSPNYVECTITQNIVLFIVTVFRHSNPTFLNLLRLHFNIILNFTPRSGL